MLSFSFSLVYFLLVYPPGPVLSFQGDLSGNMGRNGWIGAMSDDDGEDEDEDEVERDGSTTITC